MNLQYDMQIPHNHIHPWVVTVHIFHGNQTHSLCVATVA